MIVMIWLDSSHRLGGPISVTVHCVELLFTWQFFSLHVLSSCVETLKKVNINKYNIYKSVYKFVLIDGSKIDSSIHFVLYHWHLSTLIWKVCDDDSCTTYLHLTDEIILQSIAVLYESICRSILGHVTRWRLKPNG